VSATLAQVVAAMDRLYDPGRAEEWDAVGLVCGDPDARVDRVLFAVDPVDVVAAQAERLGVQLVISHHPLFLRGTTGVPATTPKGRLVHRLIGSGIGLFVAHTNADVAVSGVSEALAAALGVSPGVARPVLPTAGTGLDKLVTFVPAEQVDRVLDALSEVGAGVIGAYQRCAYRSPGRGTFLAGEDTSPTLGQPGRVELVDEERVEMVVPRRLRASAVRALLQVHPYEEPAFDVYELADVPADIGLGRVGDLSVATTLAEFVRVAAAALPSTSWGIRARGDPDSRVRRIAVCGGAGDGLFDAVCAVGADVYVTADLRHHPASEADDRLALVDAAHWATEWPWLPVAADRLRAELTRAGATVETVVSQIVTDPWTIHVDQT
jgi:dinuclear metal center YbgI/SA1388 family protein